MSYIPSFKQYLVEEEREAYFTFGRMNPPHIGHGRLMNVMSAKAGKSPYMIYLSQSQDARKNPLSFEQKIKYARKMYPKHARNIIMDMKARTPMDVASKLYEKGYNKINMVVGADRLTEFTTLLNKYNGQKGRHGFYNFEKINVISSGSRDPDGDSMEAMSATVQRQAAKKNDFTKFSQGLPTNMSNKDAKRLFNDLRIGMGLKEVREFKNKVNFEPVSETREKYIEGSLFNEGDEVRISTGERGVIHRLGTNYVIVDIGEGVRRHWLDDVTKIEESNQPEEGTPASTRKAKKMTPGEVKEDEVAFARDQIKRELDRDKEKFKDMVQRARIARARRKNREMDQKEESKGNPVAKNLNKFNKPATHKDKKKDAKRGYQKHKGQLNGGN
tara:strand:- start:4176 stop:5336 length:1161 start_codon:yes stop_codon:yes gene_type:complete